ncbi:hypothetical protein [Pseudogracilibacillus sp. SO30301A]|uniref:hypothetical protein n=1 Tax=Pseudogracilibacillus sp. SO30301A TaxID=3098291 RepID=UPI00300DD3DB
MEVFAALIPLFMMFIFIGIYLAIIGVCIWVVITFLKRQKERNETLQEIANHLKSIQIVNKEE